MDKDALNVSKDRRMSIKEFFDFSGGLSNNNKDTLMDVKELVTCSGADLSVKGIVKALLGRQQMNDVRFPTWAEDVFYQNIFSTPSIIVRIDGIVTYPDTPTLYDGLETYKPIAFNIADATMRFHVYGDWVLMCNGVKNYKYKQYNITGAGSTTTRSGGTPLLWCAGYMYPWEEEHVDSDWLPAVQFTIQRPGYWPGAKDYRTYVWCWHDWEPQHLEGVAVAAHYQSAVTMTSSSDLYGVATSLMWDYATQDVTQLGIPVELGVDAPTDAPTVAADGAGVLSGVYKYKYCWQTGEGLWSNGSPAATTASLSSNQVLISDYGSPIDPQVTAVRIYRTESAGSTYKYLTTINPQTSITYSDNAPDTSLGAVLDTDHDKPPAFISVASHRSLIYGLESPNIMWWCNAFDEYDYFASTNWEPIGGGDFGGQYLHTLGEEVAILGNSTIWRWARIVTTTDEEKKQSLSDHGVFGLKAALWKGDAIAFSDGSGLYLFDTVRDNFIAKKIIKLFDPNSSTGVALDYTPYIVIGYLDGIMLVGFPAKTYLGDLEVLYYDVDNDYFAFLTDIVTIDYDLTHDKVGKHIYEANGLYIYKMFAQTTDDYSGSDVEFTIKTKAFGEELKSGTVLTEGSGGLHTLKDFGFITIHFKLSTGDTLSCGVYVDGALADTHSFSTAGTQVQRVRVPVDKTGYTIQFEMTGTKTAEFYGVSIEYEIKG